MAFISSLSTRSLLIAFAVTAMCCSSCTSDPSGPAKSGNNLLKGTVRLLNDEYGNPIADQSGIDVVLDNGVDVFKTTTATDGSWQVANAPASVYTITASKVGFYSYANCNAVQDSQVNIQYVGAGTFTVFPLMLARDISPSMLSDPSATLEWKIRRDSTEHSGVRYDTTVTLSVRARTKNLGTFNYQVNISDRPDSDCNSAIIKQIVSLTSQNGEVKTSFEWPYGLKTLRNAFGKDVIGQTYYVQLRPRFAKNFSRTGPSQLQCLEPAVAQFTF
ncbi:MAG: carboxypeptidase regulatory-like domain-containing protein [Bacteroidetes bacterium]|nr:carboxypeptidase regulatory-like domain-containing protein [Bacteroidota bacterium]